MTKLWKKLDKLNKDFELQETSCSVIAPGSRSTFHIPRSAVSRSMPRSLHRLNTNATFSLCSEYGKRLISSSVTASTSSSFVGIKRLPRSSAACANTPKCFRSAVNNLPPQGNADKKWNRDFLRWRPPARQHRQKDTRMFPKSRPKTIRTF